MDKRLGKEVVSLENINLSIEGKQVIKDLTLHLKADDKIALVGDNELAKTSLFRLIKGEINPDSGIIKQGSTVNISYFPKNHDSYFEKNVSLVDWLRSYSEIKEESFVRGFLGRMLFSGEESLKSVTVLSGGEKVRSMLSKMMLEKGNVIILDEPTNHLDIESITSLNKGLEMFSSAMIFTTHDREMMETLANRILEIKEDGSYIDKQITYSEYLEKYAK